VQSQLLQEKLQEAGEGWCAVQLCEPPPSASASRHGSSSLPPRSPGPADSGSHPHEDPRDAAVAVLRAENEALTSRLIAASLAKAEAREREDQARHEVKLLHDLNAEVMAAGDGVWRGGRRGWLTERAAWRVQCGQACTGCGVQVCLGTASGARLPTAVLLRVLCFGCVAAVNTLSLELALLRPKAAGRAQGRLQLPFIT
jgi:hypothetical protein